MIPTNENLHILGESTIEIRCFFFIKLKYINKIKFENLLLTFKFNKKKHFIQKIQLKYCKKSVQDIAKLFLVHYFSFV